VCNDLSAFVGGHHKGDILIVIIDGTADLSERQHSAVPQGLQETVRDAEQFFDLGGL
jgi:hypothetical protein